MNTVSDNPQENNLDFHVLERNARDLAKRYDGIFDPELVQRYVFESYTALARTAKVREHLASTATHFADSRLRALAQFKDQHGSRRPQVLFVCSENAGRSQMAATLLVHLAGEAIEVRSAGLMPSSEVYSAALTVMEEAGLPMVESYPKPLTEDVLRSADYVIALGTRDLFPLYQGKVYLDWSVDDSQNSHEQKARSILDQLKPKVAELWKNIQAS